MHETQVSYIRGPDGTAAHSFVEVAGIDSLLEYRVAATEDLAHVPEGEELEGFKLVWFTSEGEELFPMQLCMSEFGRVRIVESRWLPDDARHVRIEPLEGPAAPPMADSQ